MKKKIVASIVFVSIGLVLFLFTPDGHYYYLLSQWVIGRPEVYYMEVQVTQNYEDAYLAVVVNGGKVVKVDRLIVTQRDIWLDENGYAIGDTWLSGYGYTVDAILESGRDFCFPIFECLIRTDDVFDYPIVLTFEGQGVSVQNFQPCESLDECMKIR